MQLDLLAHYENTRKRILPCGPKIVSGFEYFHSVKWNIFVETIVIWHLHILKTDETCGLARVAELELKKHIFISIRI